MLSSVDCSLWWSYHTHPKRTSSSAISSVIIIILNHYHYHDRDDCDAAQSNCCPRGSWRPRSRRSLGQFDHGQRWGQVGRHRHRHREEEHHFQWWMMIPQKILRKFDHGQLILFMTRQTQTRKGWIFFPLQAGLLHHWVKGFKQWDDNNGRDFCGSSLSPCFLPFVLIWLFLCFCDISDTNKDKHRRRRNVTSYHFFHYFNFFGYYHKVCEVGEVDEVDEVCEVCSRGRRGLCFITMF